MIIYPLHDFSNKHAIKILEDGLSKIDDQTIIKNYHPDYASDPANLFYILSAGRYAPGYGTYFMMEDGGKYICSAGWNRYAEYDNVALILSRMFIDPEHRGKYLIGSHILPICLGESIINHQKLWMTYHVVNHKTKKWFDRWRNNSMVPHDYKKFLYIGIKTIYYTQQYVYEYINTY